MSFSNLLKDTVSLLKKNGERKDGIKASVQKKKVFIEGSSILIETGDLIQKKMSNGGEETYEVIDPGFYERHGGIKAHYQIDVRKLGLPEAKQAVQSITYNITGSNARINQNSIDNSVNVVNINPEVAEHISELRAEIDKLKISDIEKQSAKEIVNTVESQFGSGKPSKPAVAALLKALPTAANIASIASLILSCM